MVLDINLRQINVRDSDSIRHFESITTLPQDLSSYLDQYLIFSAFLLAQK